mmetsp:Transcript_2995/g.9077  ORF Transcript_2995/g.9077 Transcript_2995/m.9077 type:complete len:458 (+) Transcript_2995:56-1429(+)
MAGCRICYSDEGPFISPCRCSGNRSLVHARCLRKWQRTARRKGIFGRGDTCHACDSPYRVKLVDERIPIGILGGTGLVGRRLAARLARNDHPFFALGPVAGSPASEGQPLKDVWNAKEEALASHYGPTLWTPEPCPSALDGVTVSPASALATVDYVISAIAPALGHHEDRLRDLGVAVFSISPHDRTNAANPLIVPEVNGLEALREEEGNFSVQLPLFKSPNCVVCGTSVALKALETFGVEEVAMTTFQALSGRGDAKYSPPERVVGNVFPLSGSVENTDAYQRQELLRLFPGLKKCTVFAHRVPVQNGHYVRVQCQLARCPKSVDAVKAAFRDFQQPLSVPSAPAKPIVLFDTPGRPAPLFDADLDGGFAVAVGDVRLSEDGDLSFALVVNNLVRGAWGGALLNAELYELLLRRRSSDYDKRRVTTTVDSSFSSSSVDDATQEGHTTLPAPPPPLK